MGGDTKLRIPHQVALLLYHNATSKIKSMATALENETVKPNVCLPVLAVQTNCLRVGPSGEQASSRTLGTERQSRNYPPLPGFALAGFTRGPCFK